MRRELRARLGEPTVQSQSCSIIAIMTKSTPRCTRSWSVILVRKGFSGGKLLWALTPVTSLSQVPYATQREAWATLKVLLARMCYNGLGNCSGISQMTKCFKKLASIVEPVPKCL